jgi:hypothetical protein
MIINKTYPGLIIQTTVKGSFLNPALIEEAFTLAVKLLAKGKWKSQHCT